MKPNEIIECIGHGISDAFGVNDQFLGMDGSTYRNANIKPEYISTVKVGERFTGANRIVTLEMIMKDIRHSLGIPMYEVNKPWEKYTALRNQIKNKYKFGKKRIDVAVQNTSGPSNAPFLLIEIKLDPNNKKGIIEDLNRLIRLLDMYYYANVTKKLPVYAALAFAIQKEDCDKKGLYTFAKSTIEDIEEHLTSKKMKHTWLKAKVGIIAEHLKVTQPTAEELDHGNGNTENVFAKSGYAFAPAMVLLGFEKDIENTNSLQKRYNDQGFE